MSTIDDPTIPDDLDAVLRTAARSLDVSPAPLRSVERRARQRRRRQRALVAGGAATVLLLGAVAVAAIAGGSDGHDEVVTATATDPDPAPDSVPQPLLAPDGTPVLRELTPDGPKVWTDSGPDWNPFGGVVLADGRRFAVATGVEGTSTEGLIELTDIDLTGPPSDVHRSLALDDDDGWSSNFGLIGTSGHEVVLTHLRTKAPQVRLDPESGELVGGAGIVETKTTITALDVDTGQERTIVSDDTAGQAAAAGGVLVRNVSTDCTLLVSSVDGSGSPRTIDGGCPDGIDGLDGLADRVAVSPDGRYAAAAWRMIRPAGLPDLQVAIVDLESGATVQTVDVSKQGTVLGLAWTGDRTVTVAVPHGGPALAAGAGTGAMTVQLAADPGLKFGD